MRFQHDCDKCKPLGEFGDADLYFCPAQLVGGENVIARYSDDGGDYQSGMEFADKIPALGEARNRAIAARHMTRECITHHNACDCQEAEHQFQIEAREREIKLMGAALRVAEHHASVMESFASASAIRGDALFAALEQIISDGDFSAPEGMKRLAREALAKVGSCESRRRGSNVEIRPLDAASSRPIAPALTS